jgi:hypothetical protein
LEFKFGEDVDYAYNDATYVLFPNSTNSVSPCPTNHKMLNTGAVVGTVIVNEPGEFDASVVAPGSSDAGVWNSTGVNISRTTASKEIANPGQTSRTTASIGEGWLWNQNLTGLSIESGATFDFSLSLLGCQDPDATESQRYIARVSVVTCAAGAMSWKRDLFATKITNGVGAGGQDGWRDSDFRMEHPAIDTISNATFSIATNDSYTFQEGDMMLIEMGFDDADSNTDRTVCLRYNLVDTNITVTLVTLDNTAPVVTPTDPANNEYNDTTNTFDFNYTVSDYSDIDNCSLIIEHDDSLTVNFTDVSNVTKGITNNLTVYLPNSDYNWNVNCTDSSNNIGASEVRNISINAPITYGWLDVNITWPPDPTTLVYNETFNINATVTCQGGDCGTVYALARYNLTAVPDTDIDIREGGTPFYILGSDIINLSDGFDVNSSGADSPMCIAFNTTDYTLWVIDWLDRFVYHFDGSGSNLSDGFSTLGAGASGPYGIAFDTTDNTLWVIDTLDYFVYHFDGSGTNLSGGFDIGGAGVSDPRGVAFDTTNNTFWVVDNTDAFVYHFDGSGTNLSDGFYVGGAGAGTPRGVAFDTTDNTLWVVDNTDAFVYHFDGSGSNLSDGFDVGGAGNNDPVGITFDTTDSSFWIVEGTDNFVYHFGGTNVNVKSQSLSVGESWDVGWDLNVSSLVAESYLVDVLFNSSYGNSLVPDNDTGDVTLNLNPPLIYGWLDVNITWPPDPTTLIYNNISSINATVTCQGEAGAMCGTVYALARYNLSATPDTDINITEGGTPFYILSPDIINLSGGFSTLDGGADNITGIAFDTTDYTFWITDYDDKFVYHFNGAGSNLSGGFNVGGAGAGDPAGIAVDTTDNSFWVVDPTDAFVYHFNRTGSNLSDGFYFGGAGAANAETIAFDTTDNTFWVPDSTDDFAYHFNRTGSNLSDGFDIGSAGAGHPWGIGFDPTDNTLWITDGDDDFAYHFDRTGSNLSDGFDVGGAGAQAPSGIAFDSTDNSFWVADGDDEFVYHFSASNNINVKSQTLNVGESWDVGWDLKVSSLIEESYLVDVLFNSSYGNALVPDNDTADVTLNLNPGGVYGWLDVNITWPPDPTILAYSDIFSINATVTCQPSGGSSLFCGEVYALARYNLSAAPDTDINTTEGGTPFYIIGRRDFINFSDGFSTVGGGADNITGIAFDTTDNTFWVTDYKDGFTYHFDSSGNNLSGGFGIGGAGAGNPWGIAFDTTDESFWVLDGDDYFVYHFDENGTNLSDGFDVGGAGAVNADTITFDTTDNTLWVPDSTDDFVYHFNSSGSNLSGGFYVGGAGDGAPWGIGFDPTDNSFWIVDGQDYFVYHFDRSGSNLSDGFDVGGAGVTSPYSMAFDSSTNTFWVADNDQGFVYHFGRADINVKSQTLNVGDSWTVGWSLNVSSLSKESYLVDVLFNSSYGTSSVPDNDTADVTLKLNPGYGWLDVNITWPPDPTTLVYNETFNISATVTCQGEADALCGTVYALARYNLSAVPDTDINITEGGTPFYILSPGIVNISGGFSTSGVSTGSPTGIAFDNGTFWIVEYYRYSVFHFDKNGNNLSGGFDVGDAGVSNPTGIAFDTTNSTFWVLDSTDKFVYHFDENGTNLSDGFDISGATSAYAVAFDPTDNTLWVLSNAGPFAYHFDQNGTDLGDGFSMSGSGASDTWGITFDTIDNTFWVVSFYGAFVYHFNRTGSNLSDGFGTLGSGITNPWGAAFDPTDRTFWVTSFSDLFIYHFGIIGVNVKSQTLNVGESWDVSWDLNVSSLVEESYLVDVLFNSSYGNASVPDNDTADVTLNLNPITYGWLDVNITWPPDPTTLVYNETFNINATVTCQGGDCGTVYALARYNLTAVPDNDINITEGGTPFYVLGSDIINLSGGFYVGGAGVATPWGIAFDSRDSSFWVTDSIDDFVYHFNGTDGSNLSDGLYTGGAGATNPWGVAFDPTDSTLWVEDYADYFVYHFDGSGSNLSDGFSITGAGATSPSGVGFDTTDNSFWIVDGADRFVYHFNSSGSNLSDGFNVGGAGATNPLGIAFDSRDSSFWVVDSTDAFVYHFNGSGSNLSDGFFTSGAGAGSPRDIAFDSRDSSFWVTDYSDAFVYHFGIIGVNVKSQALNVGESWDVGWDLNVSSLVEESYLVDVLFNSSYGSSNVPDNDTGDVTLNLNPPGVDTTPTVVGLEYPDNATANATSRYPDFTYNFTANIAVLNCSVWMNNGVNDFAYLLNSSTLNSTSTTLRGKDVPLSDDNYTWWVNCTDGSTQWQSETRNLEINVDNIKGIANGSDPNVTLDNLQDANSYLGLSVSAGDVNGDGFGDVVAGAFLSDKGSYGNAGRVYVWYGGSSGVVNGSSPDVTLENLQDDDSQLGNAVSAGDVNGDGFEDLIAGAYQANKSDYGTAGRVYVWYGGSSGVVNGSSPDVTLDNLQDDNSRLGYSVSAGDVNGDGFEDVIAGAYNANKSDYDSAGRVYVWYGGGSGVVNGSSPDVTLDNLQDDNSLLGSSVSAGDVNGDGFEDVVAGAQQANKSDYDYAGRVYVWYGGGSGVVNGSSPDVILENLQNDDSQLGVSVSAGDVNGDGFGDVIAGAYNANKGDYGTAGRVYVWYGNASGVNNGSSPDVTLENLQDDNSYLGRSVSAGDVNGDGFEELIAGAYGANKSDYNTAGRVYVWTFDLTPEVYLEAPGDNTFNSTTNTIDFTYNITDDGILDNCSLIINDEINITDTTMQKNTAGQNFTVYLDNGDYNWSVNCTDSGNNIGASETRNLSVNYLPANTPPNFDPISDDVHSEDFGSFNMNLTDNISDAETPDSSLLLTVTNNNTDVVTVSAVNNVTSVVTFDSVTNVSGSASINITVWDASGEVNSTTFDFVVSAVNDVPWVDLSEPVDNETNTTSNTIDFTYTPWDVESEISNCSLIINDEVNLTDSTVNVSLLNNLTTYLPNGEYNWSINCTDTANNIGTSETRNISVNYIAVTQCSPTLNADWVITDAQTCDGTEVTTGTGNIYIQTAGTLTLVNGANVTTSNLELQTTGDCIFINKGANLIIT